MFPDPGQKLMEEVCNGDTGTPDEANTALHT